MSEHTEQAAVIDWCFVNLRRYPSLELIFAIPNGARLAGNKQRRGAQMNKLKAEGLRPGVSDLFLPVARKDKHGLFIEMKTKTGKPSENQLQFMAGVEEQGYFTALCKGADEAIEVLEWYMNDEREHE
jgi:hypothetical protein